MVRIFGTKQLTALLGAGWRIAAHRIRPVDDNGDPGSATVYAGELRLRKGDATEIRMFFWIPFPLEIVNKSEHRRRFLDRVLAADPAFLESLSGNGLQVSA